MGAGPRAGRGIESGIEPRIGPGIEPRIEPGIESGIAPAEPGPRTAEGQAGDWVRSPRVAYTWVNPPCGDT